MPAFDQTFPPLLAELHTFEFDDADGKGIDFEPYSSFQSAEENDGWIRAWTGNDELEGSRFRILGQDGTGGLAAVWLGREGKPLLEQPVVFFGSEGDVGVVAADFADYLWLLAHNLGPMETIEYGAEEVGAEGGAFLEFAEKHAPEGRKSPAAIIQRAQAEFPDFKQLVESWIR